MFTLVCYLAVSKLIADKTEESPNSVVDNMPDSNIIVNEFELQLCITFTFRLIPLRKVWTFSSAARYGLNSTCTVLQQRWFWHKITHEGWYDFKTKKSNQETDKTQNIFFLFAENYGFMKYSLNKTSFFY